MVTDTTLIGLATIAGTYWSLIRKGSFLDKLIGWIMVFIVSVGLTILTQEFIGFAIIMVAIANILTMLFKV